MCFQTRDNYYCQIVMTWYIMYIYGRVLRVYDAWEDFRRQVHRFSGNSYKGYNTMVEAEARYTRYLSGVRTRNWMKTYTFVAAVIMLIFFGCLSRVCV